MATRIEKHSTRLNLYIPLFSLLLSAAIYLVINLSVPQGIFQIVKLDQIYALCALTFLYFALLARPFCASFQDFAWRQEFLESTSALAISAFYFALLHTCFSFFGELGGFAGLGFLSNSYLLAISIGLFNLITLSAAALAGLSYMVGRFEFFRLKFVSNFLYISGVLVLVHALLLGSDFSQLTNIVPQTIFLGLSFLLLLEAPRLDEFLSSIFKIPTFGLSFTILAAVLSTIFFTIINPIVGSSSPISFDIHAAHKQLAQQALQASNQSFSSNSNTNTNNIPGLNGDRTKRYTVTFSTDPQNPQPNQDVNIHFRVYDAENSLPVTIFRTFFSKQMHFIIVNNNLTFFSHIHPSFDGQDFVITTQFPQGDIYHLYIQFQPFGGIEQQVGFTLPVGTPGTQTTSTAKPDEDKLKTFGDYKLIVDTHGGLRAKDMTIGQQKITFKITQAKDGSPVSNLKPYLDSFGHLTMIEEKSFNFIHVHPYSLNVPPPDSNGGPTVDFLPIGIYGPFKPGTYRAFAEFNPDGHLFTADFTIEVK